jgi:adenylate kinase
MKTVIVFIGPPGCGKGTQSQNLCSKFEIDSYSLGELLRSYAEASHKDSLEVKTLIEKGLIVPADVVNNIVKDLLDKTSSTCLLDGYPRNIEQAKFLSNYPNLRIVPFYFALDKSALMNRILNRVQCKKCDRIYSYNLHDFDNFKCINCGSTEYYKRSDDKEEILKNRIDQFEINTAPVLDLYRGKILYEIDAAEDISKISERLSAIISELGIDFRR